MLAKMRTPWKNIYYHGYLALSGAKGLLTASPIREAVESEYVNGEVMQLLQKLFSSQKFIVLLSSAIGLLILKVFKVAVEQATIMEFVVLIGSYLVGQGLGDMGKGAAKVNAMATLATCNDAGAGLMSSTRAVEEIKKV